MEDGGWVEPGGRIGSVGLEEATHHWVAGAPPFWVELPGPGLHLTKNNRWIKSAAYKGRLALAFEDGGEDVWQGQVRVDQQAS